LQWFQSGILRTTAIFGAADPVIYKDSIIVSYSSGEIYGVNKKTGESLWSQNLNLSKATNSDFYLNDIDATPIAKDDMIYTIGNGGWMMAISTKNGNYLWRKEIAGIIDFWLAGDFLYVINNDNKLLAIHRKTGGIKWISQLPNLAKKDKLETRIIYSGVIMAGDKLVISNNSGALLIASPIDGKVEKTFLVGKRISHSPAVVGNKIYLHILGKYVVDLVEVE
jgi:outer membrane protein assembly factor BamB